MWGNRLGWGISGVILMMIAGAVYLLAESVAATPPTDLGRNPANLAALDVPMPPPDLFPEPADNTDAGDVYRQFIHVYESDPKAADDFQRASNASASIPAVPELAEVLTRATTSKRMSLFATSPGEVINYDEKPALDDLDQAVSSAARIALIVGKKDPAKARPYLDGLMALGRHLARERVRYEELRIGLAAMEMAADNIASLQPTSARGQSAAAFSARIKDFRKQHIDPIWPALGTIDKDKLEQHAGDIIVFAQSSQERMWRIEALIAMGRFKLSTGVGNQTAARRALHTLVNDPDPRVAMAAVAARDVTRETLRQAR
jgi:hypothetical protein